MSARPHPFAVTTLDRLLAAGATILLLVVLAALARGRAAWDFVPLAVWAHVATILPALALTPLMLLRPRGDRLHRRLGYAWVTLMALTALLSFRVTVSHPGHFSAIHLLSIFTLAMVPRLVLAARRHDVTRHRRAVHGLVIGALLVAGFFTFPFGRMLGSWLFG